MLQTGWSRVDSTPRLNNILKEEQRKINKHANLHESNQWEIFAAWQQKKVGFYYFFNLQDSNKERWTIRVYKYREHSPYFVEVIQRGFINPDIFSFIFRGIEFHSDCQHDQWKEVEPQETQSLVTEAFPNEKVMKAWRSTSGLVGGKTKYFLNTLTHDKKKCYIRMQTSGLEKNVLYKSNDIYYWPHPPIYTYD